MRTPEHPGATVPAPLATPVHRLQVAVDAPQFPTRTTMPPLVAATSKIGYVRLHGRNRDTYFARNVSAV